MANGFIEAQCVIATIGEQPPIRRSLSEGIGSAALFLVHSNDRSPTEPKRGIPESETQDPEELYVIGVSGFHVHGGGIEDVAILTTDASVKSPDDRAVRANISSKNYGKEPKPEDFRFAVLLRALGAAEIEAFSELHAGTVKPHMGYELLKPEIIVPKKAAVFSGTNVATPYVKLY